MALMGQSVGAVAMGAAEEEQAYGRIPWWQRSETTSETATMSETLSDASTEISLHDGTAVIPENADDNTVKQILAKTLTNDINNWDQDWQYECEGKTITNKKKTSWVSVGGYTEHNGIRTYEYPALADNDNGSYKVRIGNNDTRVTFTKVSPQKSSITLNEGVTVTIPLKANSTTDFDALRQEIFTEVINSTTPEMAFGDVTIEYNARSAAGTKQEYVKLEGDTRSIYAYPAISAGDHQIRISYGGGNSYGSTYAETFVTLEDKEIQEGNIILLNGNENPYTVGMVYTENESIDYTATEKAILNAVVARTEPAGVSVNVEYNAKNVNLSGSNKWEPLDHTPGLDNTKAFGIGTWSIRLSFPGTNEYTSAKKTVTVDMTARPEATIELGENNTAKLTYSDAGDADYDALEKSILGLFTANDGVDLSNATLEYYATAKTGSVGSLGKNWAPLAGGKVSGLDYPPISEGDQQVRLTWGGNQKYAPTTVEGTVTVTGREELPITFTASEAKLTYSQAEDGTITANVDALEQTIRKMFTAEGADLSNATLEYYATAKTGSVDDLGKNWAPLNGGKVFGLVYPAISEGTWQVRLSWPGNATYAATTKEVTVAVTGREKLKYELKVAPYEVGMQFNAEQGYDYEATIRAIYDAVVASTDPAVNYDAVKMEYTTTMDALGGNFKPLDHQGFTGWVDFKEGTWRIRITWPETVEYRETSATVEVTVSDSRIASAVVLKEGASFTYNMDSAVMKQAIFDNVIDWDNSILPDGVNISDVEIKYKAQLDVMDSSFDADKLGGLIGKIPGLENVGGSIGDIAGGLNDSTKQWMPIEGGKNLIGVPYAPMGAGEHQVQVTFKGNAEYKPSEPAAASVTVNKANVKVKVRSDNIRAGESLPENFITTDPADKFDFYIVYAGATSDISLGIYIDLPDQYDNNKFMKILDPVVEKIAGKSFTKMIQDGVTLGELRALFVNTDFIDLLEKIGVDTGAFGQIIKVASALPSVTDGVRVGFGIPNRAGLYTVTAITDNKNYNTGVGVGALLVRMHLKGVKLTWNQELGSKISAADAKNFDFKATLSKDGDTTISQSSVHYLYSGFTSKWRPYSSTTTPPTEPGRYSMTVVTLGGNYQAAPITRTFQITK